MFSPLRLCLPFHSSGLHGGPELPAPSGRNAAILALRRERGEGGCQYRWWEQFDDPVLNELIQTALRENKDLKIAAARVEEFMGRYGTTRAALFPQVGAGGSAGQKPCHGEKPYPYPVDWRESAYNLQAS